MTYELNETIAAAHAVVAEVGEDYVYPVTALGLCTYRQSNGSASCLVGRIFARLGIDLDDAFPSSINRPGGAFMDNTKSFSKLESRYLFSVPAQKFLANLQQHQDYGDAWGDALDKSVKWIGWSKS